MRVLPACAGACLAVALVVNLAWHRASAVEPMPRPDGGAVTAGVYANAYFALAYPLPAGFAPSLAGPPPSTSGYYVLATLVPQEGLTGTILIAAQDLFFSTVPEDAVATVRAIADAMARLPDMAIDRPAQAAAIAGRAFGRVDYSGVGLFRSTFVTAVRCHLVSFTFTANSRERLAALVASLDALADARAAETPRAVLWCLKDRAGARHVVRKVDPPAREPAFTKIPVRLVIGADGQVKDVHVIRASEAQRGVIADALGQWTFKPAEIDGRAAEIETGLTIEFRAGGTVAYSGGW